MRIVSHSSEVCRPVLIAALRCRLLNRWMAWHSMKTTGIKNWPRFWLSALFLQVLLSSNVVRSESPPLIPRELLFGSPTNSKSSARLSPNGKYLAYLAPDNQVFNVWVRTIGKQHDRVITQEKKRNLGSYYWQPDSEHILYLQDQNGDENLHLYQVDIQTQNTRDLTPFMGVQAHIVRLDLTTPHEMLVGLNWEDRKRHDVYRLNLTNGAVTLLARNPGDVAEWTVDNHLQVRGAQVTTPDGGTEIRVRSHSREKWRSFQKWGPDENPGWVLGFTQRFRRGARIGWMAQEHAFLPDHHPAF
jgi:hypothetical protein